jgi:hypothetical protein
MEGGFMRIAWLASLTVLLSAVGCGASGNNAHPDPAPGTGFRVTYTHTAAVGGAPGQDVLSFLLAWYVENDDGTVRGPFSNGATNTVDLGQERRDRVNLTRRMHFAYTTFMSLPARAFSYYTGDALTDDTSLNLTLLNTAAIGEVGLSAPPGTWALVQSDPYSTTVPNVFSSNVFDKDARASLFVSYRAFSSDEPESYYDFKLDLPWESFGSQTFDVATMKRSSARSWTATADLGSDRPTVIAQRNGLLLYDVGRSDSGGTGGSFGMPDRFPADNWYLGAGSMAELDVVTRIDPAPTAATVLRPFDRAIVGGSMAYDPAQRTFAFSLTALPGEPGTDSVDLGRLFLKQGGSLVWEIYFPGSAVENGVLHLPALPEHPALPAFDYVQLDLFRLDAGTTADALYWYQLDQKGNTYPCYARISADRDL